MSLPQDATEEETAMAWALLDGSIDVDIDKILADPETVDYSQPTPEQRARFKARLEEEISRRQ